MTKLGVVTGCAGFIGSHLCDRLLAEGWEVLGIDDMSVGNMQNISQIIKNPKFRFVQADVTNPKQLENITAKDADCVFHHAGKKMVFSVKQPREDLLVNIYGTLNMLMWSSTNAAKRFVMASSVAVYGNPENPPSKEDSEVAPTNPYGISKHACEQYCALWSQEYNVPAIIFRYASVYGPRQAINVGVVNAFIDKIRKGEQITVYGDGSNTRAFTYIDDVVNANMLAATTSDKSLFGQVFNVSMGKSVSVNDLIGSISAKMGKKPKVVYAPERTGEIKHMAVDISLIMKMMKFTPSVSLAEGVSRTVDYHAKEKL